MKRALLALAIASLSFASFAGPPGPPASGPVSVSVVNPLPLPTTDVPTLTNPEQLFFAGIGGVTSGAVTGYVPLGGEDVVLQSYDAWVQAAAGTSDNNCSLDAIIEDKDLNFIAALGPVSALHGRDAALSVRLPNLYVDASRELRVKVTITSPTLCVFGVQIRGVKAQ